MTRSIWQSQRLGEAPAAPGARKVVVLITDGENTTHHGSYDDAMEQAERAGAMVYALIIVPIEADAGRNTGGEHALIQMSRTPAASTTTWRTSTTSRRRSSMCRMT